MTTHPPQTRRSHRDDGAAALEFALVLPLLLLLLFGIVDFSRAYNTHISLTAAAREGARVLALNSGDPVQVTRDAAPSIPAAAITVTTTSCPNPGDPARVEASTSFDYITPVSGLVTALGGGAFASPITLTGIGVMRCGG